MSKIAKELVGGYVGGTEVGGSAGGQRLDVDVSFVDGQEEVLGAVFGPDSVKDKKERDLKRVLLPLDR